jgi:hypothetical protein
MILAIELVTINAVIYWADTLFRSVRKFAGNENYLHFCPSVRPAKKQIGSHRKDFHENLYLGIFRKSVQNILVSLKSGKIKGILHEDRYSIFIISRSVLLRMRNVSDKSCRENQNTHFVFGDFFFSRKACRLWDNVGKYCRARQGTDGNMTHAHCIQDT